MKDFDALLDEAVEARSAKPETETVDVLINGTVVTLRFSEMSSLDWANVIAVNPQRLGSPIDRQFGYNYDGAAITASPTCGVRVEGDSESKMTAEQWEKLFKVMAGHDFQKITNAIWALNEISPMRRLAEAKKKLVAGSKRKSSSPAK